MLHNSTYNPDILTCLANLSNDEVFTPPSVVNQMLDMLPAELFRSSTTTFLDPVSKSGVFLREIAKRLMAGLAEEIPDKQERANHIFTRQLFGLSITELTALISRRSVYCSKRADGRYSLCTDFKDNQGNIRYRSMEHTFMGGKCRYCGAAENVFGKNVRGDLESHAYEFIHTDNPEKLFPKMKFDVIIGNPPYQLNDGGNSASAKPIYQYFVEQAKKLRPRYLTMIIPSRWFAGGKGLEEFRNNTLEDKHVKFMKYYSDARECFPGTIIGGGVCYFLWDKTYLGDCLYTISYNGKEDIMMRNLSEFPIFIRFNTAVNIIHKIQKRKESNISNLVSARNPFGLSTSTQGEATIKRDTFKLYGSGGESFIRKDNIRTGKDLVNRYKVMIGRAISGHAGETDNNGQVKVLSTLKVIEPQSACTDTYIVIPANNINEASNIEIYLKTCFVRFLILQTVTSINITRSNYQFVPLQDFSHPWTDAMLYEKYGLSEDEIAFIESMIRPME